MAKVENYSAELTAEIVGRYVAAGTGTTDADFDARDAVIAEIAAEFGKSERSVRSKLVREDVYIRREPRSKVTGEKPEKKEVVAARLVDAVGDVEMDGRSVRLNAESLAKANKADLAILLHVFNSEIVEESEAE